MTVVSETLVSCRHCQRPLLLLHELRVADLAKLERHGRECRPHDRIELRALHDVERYFRIVQAEAAPEPGRP